MDSSNSRLDKPILVILEGGDKVGKSTVYQLFRRRTGYRPLIIDRFIGSNYVYDQYYERRTDTAGYLALERQLMGLFDIYLFVLVTDLDEQLVRICKGEHGEARKLALDNYPRIQELFLDYTRETPIEYKRILNTTHQDPEETVSAMLDYIRRIGGRTV